MLPFTPGMTGFLLGATTAAQKENRAVVGLRAWAAGFAARVRCSRGTFITADPTTDHRAQGLRPFWIQAV